MAQNAYSSTASWDDSFGKIGVRLEMDTSEGAVAIDRSIGWSRHRPRSPRRRICTSTVNFYRLEAGEHRLQTIRSWIEALFPPAITQRFLIDGEQLGTLDVKHLGQHMKEGLDDVLGQGTLHRLKYHLNGVKRKTIAALAPADERESLETLLEERETRKENIRVHNDQIRDFTSQLGELDRQRSEPGKQLDMSSEEAGSALGKLRIAFAESNSKLAQVRKEAMEWLVTDAPFLLQTEQLDLDAIDHKKAVETLRNATIQEQVLSVLETTLDEVKPKLDKAIKQRIKDTAKAGLSQTQSNLPAAFRFLTADSLEAFTLKHAVHVGDKKPAIEGFFERAVDTLNAHRTNTTNLNQASQQAGLGEIADRLEAVSAEIGRGIQHRTIANLPGLNGVPTKPR